MWNVPRAHKLYSIVGTQIGYYYYEFRLNNVQQKFRSTNLLRCYVLCYRVLYTIQWLLSEVVVEQDGVTCHICIVFHSHIFLMMNIEWCTILGNPNHVLERMLDQFRLRSIQRTHLAIEIVTFSKTFITGVGSICVIRDDALPDPSIIVQLTPYQGGNL